MSELPSRPTARILRADDADPAMAAFQQVAYRRIPRIDLRKADAHVLLALAEIEHAHCRDMIAGRSAQDVVLFYAGQ